MTKIGVIGCGWLGLPLAIDLLEKGYQVKGSTTSKTKIPQLRSHGIYAFVLQLHQNRIEGEISEFLKNIDVLILNVPPRLRRNPNENYVAKIQLLLTEIEKSSLQKIIFVSSTSVYGGIEGEVTEDSIAQPTTAAGKQLLQTEMLLKTTFPNTTIIRFGGLIGNGRHPIRQLSGKKGLSNGEDYINLIHLKDCIALIHWILTNEKWGILINGVYPYHPTKKEYYTNIATKRGVPPPEYLNTSTASSKKVITKYQVLNTEVFTTSIDED